uniref:Phosphopantothenoylcysteine decarboxylase n=1 Tax=Myotis myotis TaxID=51298 RepID=A0A7J8AQ84_MYOMY|nr:phosphopantothenoylcysteine decarboxylase [Myotis myotis]
MEPSSGRLPELEATRPHMEPRASCPAAAPSVERQFRVLVGVTGSVAALKLPLLVSQLLDIPGLEVAVVTTERAKHFYSPQDIPVTLYSDADEWEMWKCRSDPVLHIDLRRWADLMLVAPLDANTLGKVASGICDNLLVSESLCPPSSLNLSPSLLSYRLPLCKVLTLESFYHGPVCSEHCPSAPYPSHLCSDKLTEGVVDGWTRLCFLRLSTTHLPFDAQLFSLCPSFMGCHSVSLLA